MRYSLVFICLLFFGLSYAQEDVTEEEFTVETKGARLDNRSNKLSFKGFRGEPSVGWGLTRRTSNEQDWGNQTRMAFHVGLRVKYGLSKKFIPEIGVERNGFGFQTSDTVKYYSTKFSLGGSYVFKQTMNSAFYGRLELGIAEGRLTKQGFLYQNDSTFLLTDGGFSISLAAGRIDKINPDLSFVSEVGYANMSFPRLLKVSGNISRRNPDAELVYYDAAQSQLSGFNWNLVYVRIGLLIKI